MLNNFIIEAVTKIIHDCAQGFQGQSADVSSWRFHAIVNRNIRVAIESRMEEIKEDLKDFQADRALQKKQGKLVREFPKDFQGTPITPRNLAQSF